MSELHLRYVALRAQGFGHYAALEEIARGTGLDRGTVERVVKNAQDFERRAGGNDA